jgi:hypothetical protein
MATKGLQELEELHLVFRRSWSRWMAPEHLSKYLPQRIRCDIRKEMGR